jgi:endonuclease YncB( thermonuclease family)
MIKALLWLLLATALGFAASVVAVTIAAPIVSAADAPAYQCRVLRVTDGDSLVCAMVPLWPGPYAKTHTRIDGIDTPESRMPPGKCAKEVRLGKTAKAEMQRRVPVGSVVSVFWSGRLEKYGRVLASVTLPNGKDWAAEMIRLGMARVYTRSNLTKSDWCK